MGSTPVRLTDMSLSITEHLSNLTRHIDLVREACELLGNRLIEKGEVELGIAVIARGYKHDESKFHGIEWDYLHQGPDIPAEQLKMAQQSHIANNDHHPEFWGTIQEMPRVALAEMTADCYARSQEFGTSLREWIDEKATEKYDFKKGDETYVTLMEFVDLLLVNYFTESKPKKAGKKPLTKKAKPAKI